MGHASLEFVICLHNFSIKKLDCANHVTFLAVVALGQRKIAQVANMDGL
jgi:hypothetical protein